MSNSSGKGFIETGLNLKGQTEIFQAENEEGHCRYWGVRCIEAESQEGMMMLMTGELSSGA